MSAINDRVKIRFQSEPGKYNEVNVKVYTGLTAKIMMAIGRAQSTQVELADGKKATLCLNKRSVAKRILMSQNIEEAIINNVAKDSLAGKLFSTDKTKNTELNILEEASTNIIKELQFGVYECTDEQSKTILGKTEFVKQRLELATEKEKLHLQNLNADTIKSAGLEPRYQMQINNQTFFVSKIFISEDHSPKNASREAYQYGAIAYVMERGKFTPRLIYRSEADNIWRCAPVMQGMEDGGVINVGKGVEREKNPDGSPGAPIRDTTTLPFQLNKALFGMLDPKLKAVVPLLEDKTRRSAQLDTNYSIFVSIPQRTFRRANESRNNSPEFLNKVRVRKFDIIRSEPSSNDPDFSKGVKDRFKIPGTNSDEVEVFRILSHNGDYEYIFYESRCFGYNSELETNQWQELEARPWLASVQYIGSDHRLTSFLTNDQALDPGLGTLSGADRPSYFAEDYNRNELFANENIDKNNLWEEDAEKINNEMIDRRAKKEKEISESQDILNRKKEIEKAVREKKDFRSGLKAQLESGEITEQAAISFEIEFQFEDIVKKELNKIRANLNKEQTTHPKKLDSIRMPNKSPLVPTWKERQNYRVIQQFQKWREANAVTKKQ